MKKSDGNLIVREKIEMLNDQIDELAELFANKYFKDNPEFFFVGTGMIEGRLGTVCVSDMYFGVRDIILALWYDVSWDDLEERYWAVADERTKMNLRSFLRKKGYTKSDF